MSRFHPNPISRRVYNNNSASYQIDADDREHIQIGSSYRLRVPSKSNRDRRRIEETRRQAEDGSPWAGGFGGIVAGTERLRANGRRRRDDGVVGEEGEVGGFYRWRAEK
jgi:hypothetical protein